MTAHNQSGFSIILIFLIVVLVVASLGAGYLFFSSSKLGTPKDKTGKEILTNTQVTNQNTTKAENVKKISTVGEALAESTGKSIKCTRVVKDNIAPGTAYIKDGKIRFDGGNKGLMLEYKTSGLSTNEALWIWVPNATEGQKLAVSPSDPSESPKEVAKGLDEYKQDCSFVELDDKLFMAPENINFKTY